MASRNDNAKSFDEFQKTEEKMGENLHFNELLPEKQDACRSAADMIVQAIKDAQIEE